MTIVEAIVLGLVQGLTEFIPISSSAHLRIVPALLGWSDPGAAGTAVMQLGTLLAVLIYFANDIVRMSKAFFRGIISRRPFETQDGRLAWYIIAATIPVGVLGLLFKDFIETGARNLWLIASTLIVNAILISIAERYAERRPVRETEQVTFADSMAIGFGQALALIPGMSRSGSTIMVALFRGLSRSAAARVSFLLSIPAIAASGFFELLAEYDTLYSLGWGSVAVATLVSFISGYASIYFLLRFLKTHTMTVFVVYRIALGLTIMGLLYAGYLQAA